jgi:hypothetical protein
MGSNFVRSIYFLKHVTLNLYGISKYWMVWYDVLMQIICLPKIGLCWFVLVNCVMKVLLVWATLSDVSLLLLYFCLCLVKYYFEKGVILVHMVFIKVFFVLTFRYCTCLLNYCVVPSSHIAIFLLCCLCYILHVICSEYVFIMLYAMQLFVELNLGWPPGCWTYYWGAVYVV